VSTLPHIIIREDGAVSLKEEDGTERKTDLRQILSPPCMEVTPRGCRFVSKKLGVRIFLIEQAPRARTIRLSATLPEDQWTVLTESGRAKKYGLTTADRNRREFTLAFPYTVFLVCVQGISVVSLNVFFRDQPIQAMSDHLLTAAFTKDDVFVPVMDGAIPLYDQIPACVAERAIEWFWQREFSPDIGFLYRKAIAQMETVWDWEHHSLGDYLWILRARFTPFATIKESMGQFLAGTDETLSSHELVYRVFRGHLQNAVPQENREERRDTAIPTFSLRAGSSLIRLGDAIHCSANVEGLKLQPGVDYVVLGFFKPQREGQILVRLEGADDLVVIGNRSEGLRRGLELIKPTPSSLREVTSVNGSPIAQGVKFTVANHDDDLSLTVGKFYEISHIYLDQDGDVLVSILETSGNFYLTYDGGILFSSVRFLVPRLEGNTFQYGENQLSVGQVVKITDSPFPPVPKNMIVRVASVSENNSGQYVATFEGIDGAFTVFQQRKLTLDWKPYIFEHTKDKVIFGKHTLDLASGRFLFFIQAKDTFVSGKSYRIADIVPSKDSTHHPLDLDIILEQGSTPVPLIRQSQWVISEERVIVLPEPLVFPTNLEGAGTFVGRDRNGKDIMIGSMVRCLRESYNDVRWDPRTEITPGIVVHHYPEHPFLYVFYPFDLNGDGYRPGRTLGSSGIPKDYCQPRRIQIIRSRDCQLS